MARKSKNYWKRRSEETMIDLAEDAEKLIVAIKADYDRAVEDISASIHRIYGKVATDKGIPISEAEKLLTSSELLAWRRRVDEQISKMDKAFSLLSRAELALLSQHREVSRLRALQAEIGIHTAILANKQQKMADEVLEELLKKSYYSAMYDRYKDKDPVLLSIMMDDAVGLSVQDINAVLSSSWSGAVYSDRIWSETNKLAFRVRNSVGQSILTGKPVAKIVKDLETIYGEDRSGRLARLIHTETTYVKARGDILMLEKLGMEEYEFTATLDSVTSETCRSLDGKVFKTAEAVPGENLPPMHPHCRSVIVGRTDYSYGKTRLARTPGGTKYTVPVDLKYPDWLKTVGGSSG